MGTGLGFDGVFASQAVKAIAIAPNGQIYAGGFFEEAGSTTVNNIARWNGTAWSAFGAGLTETGSGVLALDLDAQGEVLATKSDIVSGMVQNQLMRWNGSAWSAAIPHPAISGPIRTFQILPNGDYILGGDFQKLGLGGATFHASHLGRWDGSQWVSMDGGLTLTNFPNDTNVQTMALRADGALFVGGWFAQSVSGVPLSGIARWQNGAWHDLVGGTRGTDGTQPANGDVRSLVIDGQGDLFAAGAFNRGNLILAGDFLGSSDGVVSPFLIRTRTDDYGLWPVLGSLPLDRLAPLGLQNLAAYAMGFDPLQADTADLPGLSLGDSPIIAADAEPATMHAMAANEESPTMKFRYRRNRSAVGVDTRVVTSPDLVGWQSAEILSTEVVESHADWERIEVTVPRNGNAKFLRLSVDLKDDF